MRSTDKVLQGLNFCNDVKLLSIILNLRGAEHALSLDGVDILGYPLSISEIFQNNNSNMDIATAISEIDKIYDLCVKKNKILLVYFSMAFGNPYEEYFHVDLLIKYMIKIKEIGVNMISLADTIGNSNPKSIFEIYSKAKNYFPSLDIGLHLHSRAENSFEKIFAGWNAGCRRFDTAIGGFGGCPFAQDTLTGNIATEKLINFVAENNIKHSLDLLAFENAYNQAKKIFN